MTGPEPAVSITGVHKAYGETRALDDCSLHAHFGEIHAIVGENGSGKSTLVKILSGVLAPNAGDVAIAGERPRAVTPRAFAALGVATVFQEVLVAGAGSVLDNVFLGVDGLFRRTVSEAERRARAGDVLERLTGAPVPLDAPIETQSLATRQWIVIARALVREPRVLILDESTAALDLEDAGALSRELERLRDGGCCVILVTHRIKELRQLADRATVLRGGASVATVGKSEITERRLLELMKGEKLEALEEETASLLAVHSGERRAIVRCSGVRLAPNAVPFDFTLYTGEVVGFAGLEAHGQRELIEALAGVTPAAGGTVASVHDGGERRYRDARAAGRERIFYVPGDRKREGLFPHLSIAENFGLPTATRDTTAGVLRPGRLRARFRALAEPLKLRYGRGSDRITTLSGGNQQKVLLARWLAAEPRALLLNDPTRGVDFETKRDLYAELRAVAAAGVGVVYLSSELEELQHVCDRVVVFRDRTVAAELPHAEATSSRLLAALFGADEAQVERPLDAQPPRVRPQVVA